MKVALLGFGTVGSGAFEAIKDAEGVEVKRIVELKDIPGYEEYHTTDINDVINDPEIELVAECMGGIHPALEFVIDCMNHGKHVVTPNKALVSAHYTELMKCAASNNVEIRFTPAAGGGIPWLYNVQRSRRCDRIEEVYGIVNGTCNFILDSMHSEGSDFNEVLKTAQDLGYAERNPSADIEGYDTQRKCVLSSNLAYGTMIEENDVPVMGISRISATDIEYFNANGYVCRLLMNSKVIGDKVSAYVEPALLRTTSLEANVKTNFNLITLVGANVGTLSFYGQGAGKMPTGTSLVHDIIDIKEGIGFVPAAGTAEISSEIDNSLESHKYYFSVSADADFPAELIDTCAEVEDRKLIITHELTVSCAHELARTLGAFAAGIR